MDLIREIVLAVRDHEGRPTGVEVQARIGDIDDGILSYHLALLAQSAMITGVETSPRKDRFCISSLALTWTGQEFADNVFNDGVWASARKTLEDAGLDSASFEVWSQIAVAKIRELCGGG